MKTTKTLYLGLAVFLSACQQAQQPFLPQYDGIDLFIENGQVFDGLGNAPFNADIAVVGDKIVFVGNASFSEKDMSNRIRHHIDAKERIIAPGFIDLHSHGNPLQTPAMENFLAMGVTTITLGQDGYSPDFNPLSTWLDNVSAKGIGTNLAMFVGHGSLRNQSGIGISDSPEQEHMNQMLEMLDDSLEYTFGLSTGLEYNPGLNAKLPELKALAEVVGSHDKLIMSHIRNEDDQHLEASIAELLEQGQSSRVHVSHLKSVYGAGTDRANEILAILREARLKGIDITADIYPYNASYTGIGILFPVWAKTPEQFKLAKKNRRAELAEYLRNRVNQRNGPGATLLGTEPWTGKTLANLSHELEMSFEDVLIDVIGPSGASGAYFVMDEVLQTSLIQDPIIGISSDGSPTGFHPRGHATFAKIIETYVYDKQLLSMAEAIRKMTSYAASILNISDRGMIKVGMIADLIVFDPENVKANATYPQPFQLADGFDLTVVNGKIARQNGALSELLAGKVLVPE